MTRSLVSARTIDRPPKQPALIGNNYRMTGGDERVGRDAKCVAWLTKVLGEIVQGSRDWPIFSERKLEQFLRAKGVDVAAAVKAHEDALPVPEFGDDPEVCVPKFYGASFLATDPHSACAFMKRRREHLRQG
jgi:hypothetical protein